MLLLNNEGIVFSVSGLSYNTVNLYQTGGSYVAVNRVDRGTSNTSNNAIVGNVYGPVTSSTVSAAVVPAPLPILGLPAVLFCSRKLKKRIKASRELSSASLV